MADLIIDTEVLRDAARDLSLVHSQFSNAHSSVDIAIEACHEFELAMAIQGFADGWNHHRKELLEQVDTLIKQLNSAADTIEKTDTGLKSRLTGTK